MTPYFMISVNFLSMPDIQIFAFEWLLMLIVFPKNKYMNINGVMK